MAPLCGIPATYETSEGITHLVPRHIPRHNDVLELGMVLSVYNNNSNSNNNNNNNHSNHNNQNTSGCFKSTSKLEFSFFIQFVDIGNTKHFRVTVVVPFTFTKTWRGITSAEMGKNGFKACYQMHLFHSFIHSFVGWFVRSFIH